MAKAKKKELTLEEKLDQALVPEDEWPYEVPGNWVWIKLLTSFDNLTSSNKKLPQKEYLKSGLYAVIDQGMDFIGGFTNNKELLFDRALPIILFGDHTRIVKYIDFPFVQGADGVKILKPRSCYDPKCFYYLLQSIDIPNLGYRRHFPLFKSLSCVLPPLAEQQRIVSRIESLFAKLDQAKELAQNAIDSFETRKAAILHKAFTGELTAKWREKNGVGLESWEEKRLGELLYPMVTKKPDKDNQSFRYIDIDAIDNETQSVREPKTILVSEAPSRASRGVEAGNILFSLVRPYLKNIAYIDEELSDCIVSTGYYVCRCKSHLNSKFLYWLLCSQDTIRYYTNYMKGDNSPSIRKEDFEGLIVNLPSLPEQKEIVRILDNIFEKEQKAKELYAVIEKIDLMKKAILARAFRGELGTNDPNEESAVELLKECLK